ncbi:MAG TPA: DUF2249 domain-containing protein [Chloroflexaceae bacterium]|nr:DUF2249 domain-containing protein [Chloroflexaceae bacterium]
MPVDATMSVNAIKVLSPATETVLRSFGLGDCCAGTMALGTAVRHHELEIEVVLAALNAVEVGRLLDARALPCHERRARVFAAAEALAPGESFLLINDHDPRPLYGRLRAERAGDWTWTYLEAGPLVYVVRLGRAPAA